jgi:hypothetical protein
MTDAAGSGFRSLWTRPAASPLYGSVRCTLLSAIKQETLLQATRDTENPLSSAAPI